MTPVMAESWLSEAPVTGLVAQPVTVARVAAAAASRLALGNFMGVGSPVVRL